MAMPRGSSDEEIEKERHKRLLRSGLILNDAAVIEAMEHGEAPARIPVKFKKGEVSGSLASAAQLGKLAEHVEKTLREMGKEVKAGSIKANPLRSPAEDPCAYCDFREEVDEARIKAKIPDNEFWQKI